MLVPWRVSNDLSKSWELEIGQLFCLYKNVMWKNFWGGKIHRHQKVELMNNPAPMSAQGLGHQILLLKR